MFDEFEKTYNQISELLSNLLVQLQIKYMEEQNKGEDKDKDLFDRLIGARMHCSHALGELVETKYSLDNNLSPAEIAVKKQYEAEMDLALDNYGKTILFTEILNDKK